MGRIVNRRIFFELAGAGIAGYFAVPLRVAARPKPAPPDTRILNTAKNVIFILLAGAPSQIDTFDLKVGAWTPADFKPTTIGDADFPEGLMPNLAAKFPRFALLRSCYSAALVHSLVLSWSQIARNPTSASGKFAPNMGSVAALELESQRRPGQKLPGFVAFSTGYLVRSGYLSGRYAPFAVTASPGGLTTLVNPDGQSTFGDRYAALQALSSAGVRRSDFDEMADLYMTARNMMYEPEIDAVFRFSNEDRNRYGNNAFGNSCIVARNLVDADLGTRYMQITFDGWDHHANIYQNNSLYRIARQLDTGLANLIADLAVLPGANGRSRLDETLIVAKGEFGRTCDLNGLAGRDHYFVHSALFAGGGVRGGQVLGSTTEDGRYIDRAGWSEDRPVGPEDVAATIYSALGIDYTTVRTDDPAGMGFEYVPATKAGPSQPVRELFL